MDIPDLTRDAPFEPASKHWARHAILAYGIQSLFNQNGEALVELDNTLRLEFGESHPITDLLNKLGAEGSEDPDLDDTVASVLVRLLKTDRPNPRLFVEGGFRIATWIASSTFKSVLRPHFKSWLKTHWIRILDTQSFLLDSPRTSVPAIQRTLNDELEGEMFAAKLTLAASDAAGVSLSEELRRDLRSIISREETQ